MGGGGGSGEIKKRHIYRVQINFEMNEWNEDKWNKVKGKLIEETLIEDTDQLLADKWI